MADWWMNCYDVELQIGDVVEVFDVSANRDGLAILFARMRAEKKYPGQPIKVLKCEIWSHGR